MRRRGPFVRLQGRNTTATVRLTTDLPNIRPVRLQVGPGLRSFANALCMTGVDHRQSTSARVTLRGRSNTL